MKYILFFLILIGCATVSQAQFFGHIKPPLSKSQKLEAIKFTGVTATDSTFFAFRPIANIAAISVPSFSAMAGAGFGVQNITYNYATQKTYCNYSINAVMFAGGNIAPAKPTATLTYAIMVGAFNNLLMAGAGVNDGKAQFIVSIGISLN